MTDQMKNTMQGWLSSKNQSKDEVEQNQAVAQAARQQNRKSSGSSSLTRLFGAAKENVANGQYKKLKKIAKKKKPKRSEWEDESEEEEEVLEASDSEDSFVVGNNESEDDDDSYDEKDESDPEADQVDQVDSEDDDEEEEDDEELQSPSPTPNKKKSRNETITIDSSSDDSDSDAGLLNSSSFKARKSKPSAALQRASQAAKNRPNESLSFAKTSKLETTKVQKISPPSSVAASKNTNLSDSDSDDSLLKTPPLGKTSKFFNKQKKSTTPPSTTTPKLPKATAKRPAHFDNDDDDDSSSQNELPPKRLHKNDDHWMADSPAIADSPMMPIKKKKKLSKKTNPFAEFANGGSSDEDDDYNLAKALAMSESMTGTKNNSSFDSQPAKKKKKKKIKKTIDISDDENEPVFKEDDHEESEDDDGDNEDDANDEGYDEEKEAATNVLQTAEGLSARVLQTMKTWMSSTKDENEDAHKGMIIEDGALALGGNVDADAANSKEWISQEYMQKILPQAQLSKYQLIGVNWMALLHTMECKISHSTNSKSKTTNVNGILADEMGLGKTVQTIAFLAYLRHQKLQQNSGEEEKRPHLIVVPVSVLPNWVREFEKFAPEMNVVKYHGSQAERQELQNDLRRYLPKKKQDSQIRNKKWSKELQSSDDTLDVILAPVTYFQKEKSDDRKFLNKFQFDYLVVDEAHMLKNAQSIRYKMLDRMGTSHRLLLTGTPVQNSPQELLNMLCFIMPLFSQGGSRSYEDEEGGNTASVSERMLQHFVEHETMEEGDEEKAYQKLKRLFAPFVLRRKKSDVIAQLLPPKERVVEYVELDMEARSIYENILAAHVNKNGTKLSAAIGDHLFTNLRKAANHPLLLRTRHTSQREIAHMTEHFHKYGAFKGEGSTRERVKEELTKFNDFHIHLTALELIDENPRRRPDLERYILPEKALFSSAKFSRLQTLLPQLISDGHRILIFSVWTSCLDLLGCLVEHLGLEYLRMDGSCPANERQELIDRFNQDSSISIFLLSTKACGLGINLTAADTCIIHDLDFNPFNDLQAEDRCHRIGQKKKVIVYKMVTKETVDADIYTMQERKAKMNAAIMESKNDDKNERREMLNQEIQRFLGSPKAENSNKKIDEVDFI